MKRNDLLIRSEFDRFIGSLQHIKTAKDLIKSGRPEKARMALVLLHSLTDGLMYIVAVQAFNYDSFISNLAPPKYPQSYRKKVLQFFNEKVEFCEKEAKLLTAGDGKIFRIAHFYRNAAYHRDIFNAKIIESIARVFFLSVLRFFVRGVGKRGGFIDTMMEGLRKEEVKIAKEFCSIGNYINYPEASVEAVRQLRKGLNIRPARLQSILAEDLRIRLDRIYRMEKESLYCKTRQQFEYFLKLAAFEMEGIPDDLFEEIRQMRYKIVKQDSEIKPSREDYLQAEKLYMQRWKNAFDSFTPKITAAVIEELERSVLCLRKAKTTKDILLQYSEADKSLVDVEVLSLYSERKIEQAVQTEMDIRRGK